ncbi:hypothetical protein FSP39_014631 [Pinctada imbricata]|uniref:Large ribosomal subunit protein bL12m n=1 Tax=Pinctada imbricata TaxID=66713 RepID=A0AA89BU08_PINIB|nr:hypothetical protein FSP39_014631 [Pinctada imbricata]
MAARQGQQIYLLHILRDTDKEYSPKIHNIVDEISKLTLVEVCDLNELLKKTLKIQDAPVMAMSAGAVAAAPKEEEEEEVAPVITKTSFTVKLTAFDAEKKIALIKELKNIIPDMNLVQAKKFVESVPQVVKDDLAKDEADNLKKKLEELGGKAEVE